LRNSVNVSLLRSNGLLNEAKRPVQPAAGFANSRPSQPQWPSVWRSSHFCLTSDSVLFGYHGESDLLASGRRLCFLCRLAIQQCCQLRTLPTRLQGVQGARLLSYFARPSIQTASGKPPFPRLSLRPRAAGETIIQWKCRRMAHTYPLSR
jgi:hypothetical protein